MDRVNVETIKRLPPPITIKGVKSFLRQARFYRRFIKDLSKIAKPLSNLFAKDVNFDFNKEFLNAFCRLKKTLIIALVMQPQD